MILLTWIKAILITLSIVLHKVVLILLQQIPIESILVYNVFMYVIYKIFKFDFFGIFKDVPGASEHFV